jgi:hypothetical protein
MSVTDSPYRTTPSRAMYVCLVCYSSLSVHPGECPKCDVERLPLADPRVRQELRAEAERRLEKRMYGEYFGLSLLGFIMAAPVILFFGEIPWMLAAVGLAGVNTQLYGRFRKRSALHVFAERRRRLGRELASPSERLLLPASSDQKPPDDDPEALDLEHVLSWLGAKID